MVLLFSNRKSKTEKEIIEILTSFGADYISDKKVSALNGPFTIVSEYKVTDLKLKKGIAVFLDDTERFNNQIFPKEIIGICEDCNTKAVEIFGQSKIPVISCGLSSKNTVTLSSFNDDSLITALQRTVFDNKGRLIEPADFKIRLKKNYNPFSVMVSVAVLLINGIVPVEL